MSVPVVVGRGKLYIGAYVAGVAPELAALEYVGNCSEIQFTPAEEDLEHKDYSEGIRSIDEVVTLQMDYAGTFTTDHITTENLTRFTKGTVVSGHIRALQSTGTRYRMVFYQNNAIKNVPDQVFDFKKVKLNPGGGFALIGDEWQKMQFSFKGLKETTFTGNEFFEIYTTTTTSTTTTTTTTAP